MRVATVAGHFGRDVGFNLARVEAVLRDAAAQRADLVALPHGVLSGYHDHLGGDDPGPPTLPEPHRVDGPEVAAIAGLAAGLSAHLVVCLGITEDAGDGCRANTAVCLAGGAVLGRHRKVHLPAGELAWYVAGDHLTTVATPAGRVGMLVDYDKTFPEAARCLALAGAELLVCPSAWPASRTNRAATLVRDRQRRLFDLYDRARAAENQLWLVSANQTGSHGSLRFFGQSKVVRPDGEIVASLGARAGLVTADVDTAAGLDARRRFHHLKERRPDVYRRLDAAAG
ncbi:MAG TPA: carbon-nitrogen hydrolase family protein [Acidimicrobiales bacterium]|nr:carbon-nitrogen hydrolase family protein [Acidimicrobiales bacterium]